MPHTLESPTSILQEKPVTAQDVYLEISREGGLGTGLYQAYKMIEQLRYDGGSLDDAVDKLRSAWLQQNDRHTDMLLALRTADEGVLEMAR